MPADDPAAAGRWKRLTPVATVFVSSLCIMVVELVAGRLIARHVGSSLYTWTSVIGIVLAGIAAGNYAGGRIADRYEPRAALSSLFLMASATCLLIPLLNDRLGALPALREMDWAARIACHVFAVFFLPSCLLGTIGPVAAKMAIEMSRRLGRAVGNVYSWGAVGSIVGTFLTGYFLIARMGTIAVLLSVAAVLLAMAILYRASGLLPWLWCGVTIACSLAAAAPFDWAKTAGKRLGLRHGADEYVFLEEESQYSYIRVEEEIETPGLRSMTLDFLIHAYVDMFDPNDLHYDYERIYAGVTEAAVAAWKPDGGARALFLGGGGFVFPRWYARRFPQAYGEVAEIDPAVTRAAFDAFGLEADTPLRIFNLDARNHVDDLLLRMTPDGQSGKFDLVYGDAFNHYSPPFHLTTYEFNEKVRRLMSGRAAFLVNVIDVYRSGRFLGAVIRTLEQSFPYVYVFCTSPGGPSDADERDTFVVVGATGLLDVKSLDYDRYSAALLAPEHLDKLRLRSGGLVLTDDFAPVDNLLAPVIRLAERE